jgi:hypothetical protein
MKNKSCFIVLLVALFACSKNIEHKSFNLNSDSINPKVESIKEPKLLLPKDSLKLDYKFHSDIPTLFKINSSTYYLGNGKSIIEFDSKGEKVSEFIVSEEILNGSKFSDFEPSIYKNMFYILLDGKLLFVDDNKKPQFVVFETEAGEQLVKFGFDNFFIPYQKSDGKGGLHNGMYKYLSDKTELEDFKNDIEFSGLNYIADKSDLYFIAENNMLHKVPLDSGNETVNQISELKNDRVWMLGFEGENLLVRQVSKDKKDIIYKLNKDRVVIDQYLLNFDYNTIHDELKKNEDLSMENPSKLFYSNYKNEIKVIRISNEGIGSVYTLK